MSTTLFIGCEMFFNNCQMLHCQHNYSSVIPHDFQPISSRIEFDSSFVTCWKSCERTEILQGFLSHHMCSDVFHMELTFHFHHNNFLNLQHNFQHVSSWIEFDSSLFICSCVETEISFWPRGYMRWNIQRNELFDRRNIWRIKHLSNQLMCNVNK